MPERLQIGLLDRVLGRRILFEDRPRDAEQPAVVAPHQAFEGPRLMGRRALEQCRVVGPLVQG